MKNIKERLDGYADLAMKIQMDLLEAKDFPDQWQGLSPSELSMLLHYHSRNIEDDLATSSGWETRSIEGMHKAGYMIHMPDEQAQTDVSAGLIPYELHWEDGDSELNGLTHVEKMQDAATKGEDLEVELADGTMIHLDPATIQDIANSKHIQKFHKYLHDLDNFQHFVGLVYGVGAPADEHSGHGGTTDIQTDGE